eukprot:2247368-Prymnesium_polylepis.1
MPPAPCPATLMQYLLVTNTTTTSAHSIPSVMRALMSPCIRSSSSQQLSLKCSLSTFFTRHTRAWLLRPSSSVPQSCVRKA